MAEAIEVLQAKRVEIVDDEGRVRVVLGVVAEGDDASYGIVLLDDAGRERAWFLADRESAMVALNYGGNTVAALSTGHGGVSGLRLCDPDGYPVVEFTNR